MAHTCTLEFFSFSKLPNGHLQRLIFRHKCEINTTQFRFKYRNVTTFITAITCGSITNIFGGHGTTLPISVSVQQSKLSHQQLAIVSITIINNIKQFSRVIISTTAAADRTIPNNSSTLSSISLRVCCWSQTPISIISICVFPACVFCRCVVSISTTCTIEQTPKNRC